MLTEIKVCGLVATIYQPEQLEEGYMVDVYVPWLEEPKRFANLYRQAAIDGAARWALNALIQKAEEAENGK